MFVRVTFVFVGIFVFVGFALSSYEEGYEAFVYEDYARSIEFFSEAMDSGEKGGQTVYYLAESYLRFSLILIGNADYEGASLNLNRAKDVLEEGLNTKAFYGEYKNYLRTLKEVNEALYVLEGLEESKSRDILLVVSLISFVVLVVFIVFLVRNLVKRGSFSRKVVISGELKDLLKELNSIFFEAKAVLKGRQSHNLVDFIEATEDRCIMLNEHLEEAEHGLRDIDEELFRVEVESTRERIREFLGVESVLVGDKQ